MLYFGAMEKTIKESPNGQGPLSEEVDAAIGQLTVETVEKWIIEDLGRARSLLQALHDDPNILRIVAVHIHGKAMNYQNAKQAKSNPIEN